MEVKVSKKDILSGYLAQFFQYGAGLLILPVILSHLTAEEIGMNYILLAVGGLTNMADFGFSGQIGRNITYVLSGSSKIYREEIETIQETDTVDYKLLKVIIDASKYLYKRLSIGVLLVLLTFGTLYISHVTKGFSNVDNSLYIWILYAFGTYFNIYFLYFNSLLTGAGLIKEQRYATIFSRLTYIIICFFLIYLGMGLLSVVIANVASPFVARYYSYHKFFSGEIKANLPNEKSETELIHSAIGDIWATAKKSGTNTIGHYVGQNASMFIAGLYLPLYLTGQWGVMTQLVGVVEGVAMNMGVSFYPEYCKLRLRGENDELIKKSSFSITTMLVLLLIGGIVIIMAGPLILNIIKSNTMLPAIVLVGFYIVKQMITCNAQLFAMLMTTRNVIPSPVAVMSTMVVQIALTILLLQYSSLGLWALLLGAFIPGCIYTLWRWVYIELDNMKISAVRFYVTGLKELLLYISTFISRQTLDIHRTI